MKIISTKIHTIIRNILKRLGLINSSFYINGPETLPPPLSPEEEAKVILTLETDRSSRMKLIEHNLRLVVYIALMSPAYINDAA